MHILYIYTYHIISYLLYSTKECRTGLSDNSTLRICRAYIYWCPLNQRIENDSVEGIKFNYNYISVIKDSDHA